MKNVHKNSSPLFQENSPNEKTCRKMQKRWVERWGDGDEVTSESGVATPCDDVVARARKTMASRSQRISLLPLNFCTTIQVAPLGNLVARARFLEHSRFPHSGGIPALLGTPSYPRRHGNAVFYPKAVPEEGELGRNCAGILAWGKAESVGQSGAAHRSSDASLHPVSRTCSSSSSLNLGNQARKKTNRHRIVFSVEHRGSVSSRHARLDRNGSWRRRRRRLVFSCFPRARIPADSCASLALASPRISSPDAFSKSTCLNQCLVI